MAGATAGTVEWRRSEWRGLWRAASVQVSPSRHNRPLSSSSTTPPCCILIVWSAEQCILIWLTLSWRAFSLVGSKQLLIQPTPLNPTKGCRPIMIIIENVNLNHSVAQEPNQNIQSSQHKHACNCVDILKHFTKCGIDCTSLSDFLPFHIYCNRSTTARLVCHSGELRRQPKWSRLKCSRLTWQRLNRDKRRFEILANFDSLRQDAQHSHHTGAFQSLKHWRSYRQFAAFHLWTKCEGSTPNFIGSCPPWQQNTFWRG